ncbi:FlaD/FlaE family flagellar protein [Haladaptatus sp. CMSO5]|uniref:FlaD/FlaE family flagellar protein n=1 Tax=Haladaptatus sp. CMSO5 TaxID=3120514 RepID=UPI002FCE036C
MRAPKPYLTTLGIAPEQVATTLSWARYLGETFGTGGALNSLRYYEEIGWISSAVRVRMVEYLKGLSLTEIHSKKYDEPATLDPPLDGLSGTPFGAHAQSLQYIADINGADLEEHLMLARLAERRVERAYDYEQTATNIAIDS